MDLSIARECPICGGRPTGVSFPYATYFNDTRFYYLKCGECKSVFVDPVPDTQTFERMYAKAAYHDRYYDGSEGVEYSDSTRLLSQYLEPGATILDFGCGAGSFLKACASQGFVPLGVDFDSDAAIFAARNANCETMSVNVFSKLTTAPSFDAIHMGDVLEHLPDPAATLAQLLRSLRSGGVLFVEGPIEENPSPVLWAAKLFGTIKRILTPTFVADHPPTHLFRTNANEQRAFFTRVDGSLSVRHWEIYETGWPYRGGGVIKSAIASLAVWMVGRHFAGVIFGNRFKAILVKA
ncbi:MAG: class I SAM-dependent methyltransferase [Burkholderiales bacterium]|nr:class I SAM-dependent methyltransferase [Burkholderiales bacterium]